MKKSLSVVVVALGAILVLLPYMPNEIIRLKNKEVISYVESVTPEKIEQNQQQEAQFDYSSVRDISLTSTVRDTSKLDRNLIIGQLVIQDINLNLPVVKGVSESNLLAGAATMRKEQVMGKGNFPLAGHYMKGKDALFGKLMDIKTGSIIKITDKKTIFEYVVYETQVVPDTAVDMISDYKSEKAGKPIISLMTCYYSSKTGKRFFALGELVREYPYENTFARIIN